jgi:hypothetical protein
VGFRRYRHRTFCLCGHQPSLEPIFGLRSLHPKIQFLAARFQRAKDRSAAWKSGILGGKNAVWGRGCIQKFRSPFDRGPHEVWCKERKRDRHVDLAHATFLTCRDLLNVGHRA